MDLFTKLAEIQEILWGSRKQETEEATWEFSEHTDLNNIIHLFPVHNPEYYISKVYKIYCDYMDTSYELGSLEIFENKVVNEIDKVDRMLIDFENIDAPEKSLGIHNLFLDGYSFYFEGLSCLEHWFYECNPKLISQAMQLIYRGDQIIHQALKEIDNKSEDMRVVI
ncbi:MAG: hypothetical protein ACLFQV_05600 [Vulcanimicrobiota bacterium]